MFVEKKKRRRYVYSGGEEEAKVPRQYNKNSKKKSRKIFVRKIVETPEASRNARDPEKGNAWGETL